MKYFVAFVQKGRKSGPNTPMDYTFEEETRPLKALPWGMRMAQVNDVWKDRDGTLYLCCKDDPAAGPIAELRRFVFTFREETV